MVITGGTLDTDPNWSSVSNSAPFVKAGSCHHVTLIFSFLTIICLSHSLRAREGRSGVGGKPAVLTARGHVFLFRLWVWTAIIRVISTIVIDVTIVSPTRETCPGPAVVPAVCLSSQILTAALSNGGHIEGNHSSGRFSNLTYGLHL